MPNLPLKPCDLINTSSRPNSQLSNSSENYNLMSFNPNLPPIPRILFPEAIDDQQVTPGLHQKYINDISKLIFNDYSSPKISIPPLNNSVHEHSLLPPIIFSQEITDASLTSFTTSLKSIHHDLTSPATMIKLERSQVIRGGTPDILQSTPTFERIPLHDDNQLHQFLPSNANIDIIGGSNINIGSDSDSESNNDNYNKIEIDSSPIPTNNIFDSELKIEIDNAFLTSDPQNDTEDQNYKPIDEQSDKRGNVIEDDDKNEGTADVHYIGINIKTEQPSSIPDFIDNEDDHNETKYTPRRTRRTKIKMSKSARTFLITIPMQPKPRKINVRSRHGCWTCRIRHKSCPEEHPVCSQCMRLTLPCDYSIERPEYMTNPSLTIEKLKQIRTITDGLKRDVLRHNKYEYHP